MSRIIRSTQCELVQFFINLFYDTFKSDREYFFILYRKMADTVIIIITGRKDIMLHRHDRLIRHCGSRQFAGRLALPIFIRLMQTLFRIISNIERICLTGRYRIILLFHPLKGILREHLASARCD